MANALSAPGGPVKLYAMADILENRLKASHKALTDRFGDKIDVPPERQFVGFDAYRKAIDCLRPGDVVVDGKESIPIKRGMVKFFNNECMILVEE